MEKLYNTLFKFRTLTLVVVTLVVLLAASAIPKVELNTDIYSYLPSDLDSVEGLAIVESFEDDGYLQLLIKDATQEEVDDLLTDIMLVEYQGMEAVVSIDLTQYLEDSNDYLYSMYVNTELNLNTDTIPGLVEIVYDVFEANDIEGGILSGSVQIPYKVDGMVLMSVAMVIILLITMILFTKSYAEPLIVLTSVGIAILINMGTNIMFKDGISDMTFSSAALLQLAVSIDYALILMNNYRKIKSKEEDTDKALVTSVKISLRPILTGAITTVAGFAALTAMSFNIGQDMGLVLAKGIIISLFVTVFVLPVILKVTDKLINKFEHKQIMPNFEFFGKAVGNKLSPIFVVTLVLLGGIGLFAKFNIDYLYGEPPVDANEAYVYDNFEVDNILIVLFESDEVTTDGMNAFVAGLSDVENLIQTDMANGKFTYLNQDLALTLALMSDEYTQLVGVIDYCVSDSTALPECAMFDETTLTSISLGYITSAEVATAAIASQIADEFTTEDGYERVLVFINDPENVMESKEIFAAVDEVVALAHEHLSEDAIVTGESALLNDMQTIMLKDDKVVTAISIIAVLLVLIIAFRSLSVPFLLVLVIEGAIMINLLMSYAAGHNLLYMGVVIIGSMQLGATIDYAVLLTEKYEHSRYNSKLEKKEAVIKAVRTSSHTLLTSGLSLGFGGLSLLLFQTGSIAELGLLLSRGAFISLFVTLVIMPHVLYLFDFVFIKKSKLEATE